MRIILSDPFSDGSSIYVACVCNHCHLTNQNCHSMMGLTSHLSCVYDIFSYYHASFYSMTILKMMGLGPGHLVCALFYFPLKILLVVSVAQNQLIVSVDYFPLVVSVEFFIESSHKIRWSCQWTIFIELIQWNILIWSSH